MSYHDAGLGRYRLGRCLGTGGMGRVWAAVDTRMGREVAIKVVKPELAVNPQALVRFGREVSASMALNHPNLVRTLDCGEEAGQLYLVMELVDGQTLDALTAAGRTLELPRALDVIADVLHALDYLHARGYVHRDVTGRNVMVDRTGRTVLMDFGLVKVLDASALTRQGALIGTPRQMAPEMLAGRAGDARMDLYQTGFLLCDVAARTAPFEGAKMASLMQGALDVEPEIPPMLAAAGSSMVEFLRNALSARVERRYASARAMLADLGALREGRPVHRLSGRDAGPGLPAGDEILVEFELLRVLRTDGLCTWYEARRRKDASLVHLQMFHAAGATGSLPARALHLLRATASLAGPHLAVPLEVRVGGPGVVLVHPERTARTLAELLVEPGALAPGYFPPLARSLVSAIQGLHQQGRVHGHISPDTVFLLPSGHALLGGLELAALSDLTVPAPAPDSTQRLNPYAAPEQASGVPPTFAADVYATARLLLWLARREEEIDPFGDVERWPTAARARILRRLEMALEADPARRPSTGAELSVSLAPLFGSGSPGSWSGTSRRVLAAGALMVAAFGALLARLPGSPAVPARPAPVPFPSFSKQVVEYALPEARLSVECSRPVMVRAVYWPETRLSERCVALGVRPARTHSLSLRLPRSDDGMAYRIEWADEPPIGWLEVGGGRVAGLAERLGGYRDAVAAIIAPAIAGGDVATLGERVRASAAKQASARRELERIAPAVLSATDVPGEIRESMYSCLALLDLADAALEHADLPAQFSVERLLPGSWTWAAGVAPPADRVVQLALPAVVHRSPHPPSARAVVAHRTSHLAFDLDEGVARWRRARVLAVWPDTDASHARSRVLGVSINGSVELILRHRRPGLPPHHTFDPGLLVAGRNVVAVHRRTVDPAAGLDDHGPITLRIELSR